MSKMKLFRAVVDDLHNLATSMSEMADAMEGNTTEPTPTVQPTEPTPSEPETKVTIETLREVMAALSLAGKKAKIKALLQKYNSDKLSDVDKADYQSLYAEAKKL